MKQPLAVTLLVLASVISTSALAQQSTLRPLDASAASLISGGTAPASSQSQPTYVAPSTGSLSPMSDSGAATAAPLMQMPAAGPRVPASAMLPAGTRLSVALDRYVRERGWDLRWQIDEDYVLDANLPIPTADLIEGVTWVVHTYQSQGGMYGVVPRFARSNHVVVIEKMDVRENY